jgi:DNA-binding transcriptional ArsR family regulator
MNPKNSRYKQYNRQLLLMALSDGDWHRNMELKKETDLSQRTLSKHLDELEKENWIERKEDRISGLYPYPVLYRANSNGAVFGLFIKMVFDNEKRIEAYLKEGKDPIELFQEFQSMNVYFFTLILEQIQNSDFKVLEPIDLVLEFSILGPYEFYTKSLIEAFTKSVQFGARYDINQLRKKYNIWNGIE